MKGSKQSMTDTFEGKTAEEWAALFREAIDEYMHYQDLIFQRQQREQAETKVLLGVEVDGKILHRTTEPEQAQRAAELYDNGEIVTWKETVPKKVTFS